MGCFRSDDAGQSWSLVDDGMDITQRAFYYGNVFVDPKDANTIYLPNVGVYVSHDGGKKLTALRPRHGVRPTCSGSTPPNNPQILVEGDAAARPSPERRQAFSSENTQPTGQFPITPISTISSPS